MRWRWLAAGIGIICSMGLFLGYFVVTSRPKTYREAVIIALERHQIAYRAVAVGELCKPDPGMCIGSDFRVSSAFVNVTMDRPLVGHMDCFYYQSDCYLWLAEVKLRHEPLPDIVGVRTRPTPLDRFIEYIKALLRVKTRWIMSRSGTSL